MKKSWISAYSHEIRSVFELFKLPIRQRTIKWTFYYFRVLYKIPKNIIDKTILW